MTSKELHTKPSTAPQTQVSSQDARASVNNMLISAKPVKETSPQANAAGKLQNPQEAPIPPAIEKWADLIYKKPANSIQVDPSATKTDVTPANDLMPTVTMSRFGIKNPRDIAAFLMSPSGKSLMTNIGMEMAAEKSLDDYLQLQRRERAIMMHRIQAAFFLWVLDKKAHSHDKQKEIVLGQNAKAIQNSAKTSAPATSSALNTTQQLGLMQAVDDYQKALTQNKQRSNELVDEREALDKQLGKLNAEGELINFKYNVFEAQLNDFHGFLSALATQHDKSDPLELLGSNTPEGAKAKEQIALHIEKIQQKMDEYLLHVEDLIQNNQDEEASILMKMHTALGLQVAAHFDMIAVHDKKKYYVREDGTEAKKLSEACFVLDTHAHTHDEALDDSLKAIKPELRCERIHKDNDKYYLLKPGQTWDSIKDDQEAKNEAQKQFEHKKPALLVVQNLVHHNRGLETSFHQDQVHNVKGKIKTNEEESQLNNNRKNALESCIAQSKAQMQEIENNVNLNATTPTPTPKPRPVSAPTGPSSSPQPRPQGSTAQTYKEDLEKLKQSKLRMTPEQLLTLAGQAPESQRGEAQKYVQSEIARQRFPSSAPIPFVAMQSMLQNLARFGVNPNKPSVTPIKSPLDQVKEPARNTGPTPLSTNPFKLPGS